MCTCYAVPIGSHDPGNYVDMSTSCVVPIGSYDPSNSADMSTGCVVPIGSHDPGNLLGLSHREARLVERLRESEHQSQQLQQHLAVSQAQLAKAWGTTGNQRYYSVTLCFLFCGTVFFSLSLCKTVFYLLMMTTWMQWLNYRKW